MVSDTKCAFARMYELVYAEHVEHVKRYYIFNGYSLYNLFKGTQFIFAATCWLWNSRE